MVHGTPINIVLIYGVMQNKIVSVSVSDESGMNKKMNISAETAKSKLGKFDIEMHQENHGFCRGWIDTE